MGQRYKKYFNTKYFCAQLKTLNNLIMAKSISKQLEEKAKSDAEQKALAEKAALENQGKTPEQIELNKLEAEKIKAEAEKAEKEKKEQPVVATKEDLKKKFPKLNDEQLSLLMEVEAPEPKKEETQQAPVSQAPTLTPEIQAKLDLIASIYNDPEKSAYLEAINNGTIWNVLSEVAPKGEDYSKLKPRDLFEKSLQLEGIEKEELAKELESFDALSYYEKKKRGNEALEILNSKNPSIAPEVTKKLQKQVEIKKQADAVYAQRDAVATKILNETVTSLIGKDINGVPVTNENAKELQALIIKVTPQIQSPQGGMDYDMKSGIENGKILFSHNQVVSAKDKKIKDLQDLVKVLKDREEQKARPALNYVRGNGKVQEVSDSKRKGVVNPWLQ